MIVRDGGQNSELVPTIDCVAAQAGAASRRA